MKGLTAALFVGTSFISKTLAMSKYHGTTRRLNDGIKIDVFQMKDHLVVWEKATCIGLQVILMLSCPHLMFILDINVLSLRENTVRSKGSFSFRDKFISYFCF